MIWIRDGCGAVATHNLKIAGESPLFVGATLRPPLPHADFCADSGNIKHTANVSIKTKSPALGFGKNKMGTASSWRSNVRSIWKCAPRTAEPHNPGLDADLLRTCCLFPATRRRVFSLWGRGSSVERFSCVQDIRI